MRKTAVAALFLAGALVAPFAALADTAITAAGSTALLPLVCESTVRHLRAETSDQSSPAPHAS